MRPRHLRALFSLEPQDERHQEIILSIGIERAKTIGMNTLLLVVHVTACILLVIAVLLQAGKDGGLGMAGGGSSQTVFGSSGGANFFTKFTSIVAAVFMLTSIALTVIKSGKKRSIFDDASAPVTTSAPAAAPAAPAAAPAAPAAPATH